MINNSYKVALLCTCFVNDGIRSISSILKKNKINTELFFLGTNKDLYNSKEIKSILTALIKLNPNIIGISSITLSKRKTVQLINAIKKDNLLKKIKIIWGGAQVIVDQNFCLKYVDMVCVGECDFSFLELIKKDMANLPYLDTPNFVFKNKKVNKLNKLVNPLDKLPFEDYDIKNHHILKDNFLINFKNKEKSNNYLNLLSSATISAYPQNYFSNNLNDIYPKRSIEKQSILNIILARGCPFGCSYCINNHLKKIYDSWGVIRYRSVEDSIKNIAKISKKLNPSFIFLLEDDFLLRSLENIKEFSKLYKKFISRPLLVQFTSNSFSESKFKYLVDAGLKISVMGIQSGSERINNDVYHRSSNNKKIIKAVKIINKYKNKIFLPWFDFIIDNPYENEDDILATINLIKDFPTPFFAKMHNLVLFPKTELYNRVKKDSLFEKDKTNIVFQDFKEHKKYWHNNFYLTLLLSEISGICNEQYLGKIKRKKINKLIDKSFIKRMENKNRSFFTNISDLNSLT